MDFKPVFNGCGEQFRVGVSAGNDTGQSDTIVLVPGVITGACSVIRSNSLRIVWTVLPEPSGPIINEF